MGMELANPLVAAASPLSGNIGGLLALEEAGASAIVLQSLFEEQIEHHELSVHSILETGTDSFPEAHNFFPGLDDYNTGPESYLQMVEEAKERLTVPVIASINGVSRGGWIRYAHLLEEAGADALELNIYFVAADPRVTSSEVEARYVDLVGEVASSISIPLAVKVGPYFSSMANMAQRLAIAGASGLVLFNRFLYPNISLASMKVVPTLSLSSSYESLLPLRWIAIISSQVRISLAASTGVHTAHGRDQASDGRRGRDDDGVGALASWARSPAARGTRVERLAGRARVRVGQAAQRLHEPGIVPRSRGLRARQLHAYAGRLHGRLARPAAFLRPPRPDSVGLRVARI
jgi:dihydroorotate dehydrogenase (fumarate)